MLNFFFLVNFFLAIIVNGYTRYSDFTELTDVENDIISDTVIGLFRIWSGIRYRWSSNKTIALAISELPSTFIAIEHLKDLKDTHSRNVFHDRGSAEAFHKFYSTWVSALTEFGEGQSPDNDVRPLLLAMESRQNVRLARAELELELLGGGNKRKALAVGAQSNGASPEEMADSDIVLSPEYNNIGI
jgi:hypothetical protein